MHWVAQDNQMKWLEQSRFWPVMMQASLQGKQCQWMVGGMPCVLGETKLESY
jgi:hypothetical protein